jgi:hypothetical protein
MHKHKHRKVFQSEWKLFLEENHNIIEEEIQKIHSSGYKGDVLEKMFHSARYYYRKKQTKEVSAKKERKEYEKLPKSILQDMDIHIREQIQKGSSPTSSFYDYLEKIQTLLKKESNIEIQEIIKQKLKKSYKNRYQVEMTKTKTNIL